MAPPWRRRARIPARCQWLSAGWTLSPTHQDPSPKFTPLFSNTSPVTPHKCAESRPWTTDRPCRPMCFHKQIFLPARSHPSCLRSLCSQGLSFSTSPLCPPCAIRSYVFLVPLPALQLLLEAPSCPQPLLGQVPDPLLHEAEGLLARADQLQEASQVAPESCLGKEHALHFECRESSRERSPWAATGLPIAAEVLWVLPGWTACPGATRPDTRAPPLSAPNPRGPVAPRASCDILDSSVQ